MLVLSGVDIEVWLTDQFNGANTRRVRYTTTYAFSNTTDVTGSMSSAVSGDTTPPAQVNGLAVTTASSTRLNLNWTANTDSDLNHYNIYRGTTNGFTVTLGVTPPTATTTNPPTANSYQDTGLTPSTTYYYKVSAVDNAGNIGPYSSPDQSATTAAVFRYHATSSGKWSWCYYLLVVLELNLAWTANTDSDLNHYNIYRGTTNGFTVTLGVTPPTATTTNPPTANSYQDTGLTPSTTYYYKVSAVDNAGNIGPYSSPDQSATTAAISQSCIL